MPSIEEGIARLKSLSDAKDLEKRILDIKLMLEDGTITPEQADQKLKEFKRNRGMANGGEIKDGIATFIPHMRNGGLLNSFNEIMKALIFVESRGNPNAVSEAGAIGLTQIKVPTAMQPGNKVENIFQIARKNGVKFSGETEEEARRLLFIPSLNVQFGEQYLKAMIRRFGNVRDGITAYNQGPKTFSEYIKAGRDPSILSKEGRDYLPKVLQAIGVEDFGFENIPSVAPEDKRTLGSVLPENLMVAGQELLKSDDDILPVYAPEPQTKPPVSQPETPVVKIPDEVKPKPVTPPVADERPQVKPKPPVVSKPQGPVVNFDFYGYIESTTLVLKLHLPGA